MSSWQQRLYESYCGCCISKAVLRSREIDRQIAEDDRRYRRQINVLLLGAIGSGKSTFLKQANILFRKDFNNDELNEFRPIIYGDILLRMRVLVGAQRKLRIEWDDPSNQQHEEKILNFQVTKHIDSEKFMSYFESIKSLRSDKAIQYVFAGRVGLQLVRIFIHKLSSICTVGGHFKLARTWQS